MNTAMRKRRSMLYVPGNNASMVQQAGVYGADCVLLDLEDAIAPSEKDAARVLLKYSIPTVNFYGAEVTVRVNHLDTPFGLEDLQVIVPIQPDALRLPKMETPEDVLRVVRTVESIEKQHNLPHDHLKFQVMIETAIGVENALDIARSSPRIHAITIGGQDLAADMGIILEKGSQGLDYASKRIVMAAKAARIEAMDTVFVDVEDEDGLREATRYAKEIGFTGKAAINPRQIEVINAVFTPSEEDIEKAIDIISAYNRHKANGVGVFAIRGKMVDAPIVTRALHLLELADIDSKTL
ncbi:CoA ester lyase [candidate division KSB3 bacterium]|uniref:CoA ester lyase n=1 Tax=candidate division KSB3 bacterium TaxID=2044937 RepID=A0A2G6E4Q8_9BACT|nr:MAG: CoA ester lyase [candidate division KSB3 bacterium]PIE29630.1 MAG: CoA ester lyase [candidate division KSB3 bacterium]